MCWKYFRLILEARRTGSEFFGDEVDRIMEIEALTERGESAAGTCGDLSGVPLCCTERKR